MPLSPKVKGTVMGLLDCRLVMANLFVNRNNF
jgi:hypothetical protein